MADMDEVHIVVAGQARTWGGAYLQCFDYPSPFTKHFVARTPVRANAEKMLPLLIEAANELETYIDRDYPEGTLQYPINRSRKARDMDLPNRIRAIIAAAEGRGEGK